MARGGTAELELLGLCGFSHSGASQLKSETGPCTQRAKGEERKRQTAPDQQAAVPVSKGTYLRGVSQAARILKVHIEA